MHVEISSRQLTCHTYRISAPSGIVIRGVDFSDLYSCRDFPLFWVGCSKLLKAFGVDELVISFQFVGTL